MTLGVQTSSEVRTLCAEWRSELERLLAELARHRAAERALRHRVALQVAYRRRCRHMLLSTFSQWHARVERMAAVAAVVLGASSRTLARCVGRWMQMVVRVRPLRHAAAFIVRRRMRHMQATALGHWQQWLQWRRRKVVALRVIARRNMHLMQLVAVRHWRAVARSRRYTAVAVADVTARRDGSRLEQAWDTWLALTHRTRWVLLNVSRKRQLLGRRLLLTALSGWSAHTAACIARVLLLRRCIGRHTFAQLQRLWAAWVHLCSEAAHVHARAELMAVHSVRRSTSVLLRHWANVAVAAATAYEHLHQARRRQLWRLLRSTFTHWAACTASAHWVSAPSCSTLAPIATLAPTATLSHPPQTGVHTGAHAYAGGGALREAHAGDGDAGLGGGDAPRPRPGTTQPPHHHLAPHPCVPLGSWVDALWAVSESGCVGHPWQARLVLRATMRRQRAVAGAAVRAWREAVRLTTTLHTALHRARSYHARRTAAAATAHWWQYVTQQRHRRHVLTAWLRRRVLACARRALHGWTDVMQHINALATSVAHLQR